MRKALITQSNYIPWKGYFDAVNMADVFIIYDDTQYTKRDWRNRNIIKTSQGLQWLSIPVEVRGKFFQKINETKISDNEWARKHWKTISLNYSKALFFNSYKDVFEDMYLGCREQYLSKINFTFLKTINEILGTKTEILWSNDFQLVEGKTERLVDLCKKVGASEYLTGPAAKNYMDENMFTAENINITYLDYSGYPEYRQLYPPFEHAVSILDLIFNEGDNAVKFMKSFK